jgi:2-polyprenyl-3-methyl-5-hydroxy-6-metoxy-1,4-benzoquinol methylase
VEVPSLKGELRELIARYLELYYVSESCKDGIRTENRYQSIRLGDLEIDGVRSIRDDFLDQVDFSGKRVLDLGSNLGELSRGARARGASLVDGFEHDPFFVELATAIDAYGQVSRVSHHERDITDPAT